MSGSYVCSGMVCTIVTRDISRAVFLARTERTAPDPRAELQAPKPKEESLFGHGSTHAWVTPITLLPRHPPVST